MATIKLRRLKKQQPQPPRPGVARVWISSDECSYLCNLLNTYLNNSVRSFKKTPEVYKARLALSDLIDRLYGLYNNQSQSFHSGSIKLDLTQTEVPKLIEVMMKNEETKLINPVLMTKLRLRIQHAQSDALFELRDSKDNAKLTERAEAGESRPVTKVRPPVFDAAEAARFVKVKSRVRRKTGESNGSSQGS
jgi:hypothetical protein